MTMKDAIIASPEKTAYLRIDGRRAYLGYGNGSVFIADRSDNFKIIKKVSSKRLDKLSTIRWEPLNVSSR